MGKHKTNKIGMLYIGLLPLLGIFITSIPINSNAVVNLPFLENTPYSRILVFGGFPDCSTACPLSLSTLRETYLEYQNETNKSDVGVIFVNIRHNAPDALSDQYIKSFHPDFESYSTKSSDSKSLYTSLALKTFKNDEKITHHKGAIYLFKASNDQWHLENIFQNNVQKETLIKYLVSNPV